MMNFPFEFLHPGDMWSLRFTACPNGSDDSFVTPVRGIVDYPSAFFVLVDFVDFEIEACFFFEAVSFPEFGDLAEDLLTVGVATVPFY